MKCELISVDAEVEICKMAIFGAWVWREFKIGRAIDAGAVMRTLRKEGEMRSKILLMFAESAC